MCWSYWNTKLVALYVVTALLVLILSGRELLSVCLFVFALCKEGRITNHSAERTVTERRQVWNHFCRCISISLHISDLANKYEGRTESHEQHFFACELGTADEGECGGRWNQLLCYLECLVTSIACITWLVSLLTKWPTTICRFASVLSSNSLWKRKSLLQKFTRDFSVLMEVCAWVRAVFEDGWNVLKMGKRRQFRKQCVIVFGWLERSSTAGEFSNFQNGGRNVYKEVAIMWKNKESYVD